MLTQTYQREIVDDMLLLQHLQAQELDLLLVPCHTEVIQGSVPLQGRLCRQLLLLQPREERALQGHSSTTLDRNPPYASGRGVWAWGYGMEEWRDG